MLSVQYDIKIGRSQFKSDGHSRLIDLLCDSTLTTPVNSCRMTFTQPQDVSFTEGDAVVVKLGYGGELSLVFTGIVKNIAWQMGIVVIEAHSSFHALAALRTNAYFENAFAADIVKGLASEAKVTVGTSHPGLRFAFYAVGNNRSAWQYIHDLAVQCGFDFYANAKDQLMFSKPTPKGLPTVLAFSTEILACQIETTKEVTTGVEVFGESPASFGQGTQASTWFTKNEVKGTGGKASKAVRYYVPTARTQEEATKIANALWQQLKPKKKGTLTVIGQADIGIGTAIDIKKMPISTQNGQFKVNGVRHTIRNNTGFLTQLIVEQTE